MKKHNESLFQIGEVAKILGITRKALLVYEEKGLLTPALKDKESGYRYYSADNMTQIRSILSLQALGLSLKEIAAFQNMKAILSLSQEVFSKMPMARYLKVLLLI